MRNPIQETLPMPKYEMHINCPPTDDYHDLVAQGEAAAGGGCRKPRSNLYLVIFRKVIVSALYFFGRAR